jgi:PAS domain S-box-containing protein
MAKVQLKFNSIFVYSYLLFIVVFLALIINFYNEEKYNENRENREFLQTLAKIKSVEIKHWFNERLSDAAYLFSNFYLKENLPGFITSPNKSDSLQFAKVVESMFENHDYKNIFIINNEGECIICMNPKQHGNFIKDSINSALKSGKIKFSNFYKNSLDSGVDLDIYIPIINSGKPSAVVILKIDPYKIIFPTIQNWLINDSSGESFLVYKEKDSVVFINNLKYSYSAPLTLKIPLSRLEIPAVKVSLGTRGIVEGIDYRGEKVLADLRPIENTPWLLVSKIDLSEIYQPVSNRLSFILIFLLPLFAVTGLTFLYFQSRQNFKNLLKYNESQQALTESEGRYRSLFQNNHSVMLLIDPESGEVVDANPAALKFYGYTYEDITKLHISDINQLPPAEIFKEMERAKKEQRRHFFFRHKLANNEIRNVEVFSGPISFKEKTFLYSIIHDITERKVAEENLRKLTAGIEQSPASIVITDKDGNIEYVNPKFTSLTGYSFEEVKGKKPSILKSGKMTSEDYSHLWNTISNKKDWRGEFLNKKKDGELYWELALISPILDKQGEITNYIAIKEDITDAKNADEAFKKMTAELMQQNRNLEQFTYIMSHNLRTPVANILGISDAMQHVELDDNEKSLMMKGLFSSVKKLDEVILDLSNILQVKQGVNEKKERVHFSKLVQDIKTSISSLIEAEHAQIKTDFTAIDEMMTLKSYMYSIFYNLILNSIKYKRIDSNPLIEIKSAKEDGKIILFFKDNGIGIDLKKKGKEVFGLYKRFHTHTEGKGMGLFMTKMQTETLGGKIQIQSEVNKGTQFVLEFECS